MAAPYLLIGEKLSHSYSPEIHALLGDYAYQLKELPPDAVDAFIRAKGFPGANVTIPYKVNAFRACDELSETARMMGNVNTLVVKRDGTLSGHNTDLYGLTYMIKRSGIGIEGKKIAVLGASGGAGMTAVAAANRMGAGEVVRVSRSGPVTYEDLYRDHADAEVVINATPVGMYPNCGVSPVDLDRLPCVRGVLDLIYNPNKTRLLLDAEARCIAHENGLSMLVAQAARAKEIFTSAPATDADIERIITELTRRQLNIALIGMPGSGKSSIGRELAARMGREFVDADNEIVARAGMPIPDIFAKYGEPRFREIESEVIAEMGRGRSLVIATGGGAVMREQNRDALRQNGVLAWIRRDIGKLPTAGRPLSKDAAALAEMAAKREPVYRAACDIQIENTAGVADAARAIEEGYYEAAGR